MALRMTYDNENIENGGCAVYHFDVDNKTYRMEHTPHQSPFWTLDAETRTEYLAIAVGPDAVAIWLAAHGITGIL